MTAERASGRQTPSPGAGLAVPVLRTARLVLRPFRDGDLDAIAAMGADPEVMRYLGDGRTLDREDAWRQMAMLAGHWAFRGFGMWVLEEAATGTVVGRTGLHYPEGWPEREVGWALARQHWGQGYATEAARAALDHAFGTLGWDRAVSLIHPDNVRSIRVAERLGERFEREVRVRGHPARLYAVSRASWTERAGGPEASPRSSGPG
jgi:RimJ/RimL family protein N-acetyltransferase